MTFVDMKSQSIFYYLIYWFFFSDNRLRVKITAGYFLEVNLI